MNREMNARDMEKLVDGYGIIPALTAILIERNPAGLTKIQPEHPGYFRNKFKENLPEADRHLVAPSDFF